jgi:hypothetical protein
MRVVAGGRPAEGAVPPTSPLIGVRCSPEGERTVVEPARGGALCREPESCR